MLVLSRKVGERILVGDDIIVAVVRIGPNAVRLGITATEGVNIVREELVERPATTASPPQATERIPSIAERSGLKIQPDESDLEDLGRRPRGEFLEADEVADAYIESEVIDHGC